MENHTAKHFVLQLGSLASLYLSLIFLLTLLFGIINVTFPDVINDYWQIEDSQSQIRIGIAMVLVFFPTYLILTRTVNKLRRSESNGTYLTLTKWLVYLSLLGGGAALLGDLVAVIMGYLEGEITQRFILKAGAVFVVIGAAFYYYILDARGHWLQKESQSKLYALIATIIVFTVVGFGITKAGSPQDAREGRLDEKQVHDLQSIQWKIEEYYYKNDKLPENLEVLSSLQPETPKAPEGRADYTYNITEEGFNLCATFTSTNSAADFRAWDSPAVSSDTLIPNAWNWEHTTGDYCFERTINKNWVNTTQPK